MVVVELEVLEEDELDDCELELLEPVVVEDDDEEGQDSEVLATLPGNGSDEIGAPCASW